MLSPDQLAALTKEVDAAMKTRARDLIGPAVSRVPPAWVMLIAVRRANGKNDATTTLRGGQGVQRHGRLVGRRA